MASKKMPAGAASAYHAMGDCDGPPTCGACVAERAEARKEARALEKA